MNIKELHRVFMPILHHIMTIFTVVSRNYTLQLLLLLVMHYNHKHDAFEDVPAAL